MEKVIFIALLVRAYITDCKTKKIENEIILLLLINKVCFCIFDFLIGVYDVHKFEECMVENVLFWLILLVLYHICTSVGAGDIKILCVSKLYFVGNEAIDWLLILLALLVIALFITLITNRKRNLRITFAPYVLLSVLLFYAKNI